MTTADETDPWEGLNASPIEMEAASWCERREQSGWNAHDQAELDAWFGQSPAHAVAFLRMSHAWSRADRLGALRQPLRPSHASNTGDVRAVAPKRIVALLAVFTVIAAAIGLYVSQPPGEVFSTPVGGREVLTLADGSQVELNTDTALRVRVDAQARIVFLDRGEAYFQVKHDSSHPFVVIAHDHRITDLGTKFSVREDGSRLKVALLEGRARINSTGKGVARSAVLTPGDVALATADSLSVAREPADRLTNALGWRRGVLIFNHTTLEEAAREVNRYSRKKLVIADRKAARLMIGGTFAASNADSIAEAAKEFFGLQIEDRGNQLVISK